jgi:hypothetical protein
MSIFWISRSSFASVILVNHSLTFLWAGFDGSLAFPSKDLAQDRALRENSWMQLPTCSKFAAASGISGAF